MHSRLILKKLILTGNGKQDAVINFHEGLNVLQEPLILESHLRLSA